MRRCVREDEIYDIQHAFHDEPCGGHFVGKIKTLKKLLGIISQHYIRMQKIIPPIVTDDRGWANQPSEMRCHSIHRLSSHPLISGVWNL